jgi:hypothetical protein
MPVTRSRTYLADLGLDNSLDSNNTTGFLFGDEDSNSEVRNFSQVANTDNFPTLVRREGFPSMVSVLISSKSFSVFPQILYSTEESETSS